MLFATALSRATTLRCFTRHDICRGCCCRRDGRRIAEATSSLPHCLATLPRRSSPQRAVTGCIARRYATALLEVSVLFDENVAIKARAMSYATPLSATIYGYGYFLLFFMPLVYYAALLPHEGLPRHYHHTQQKLIA